MGALFGLVGLSLGASLFRFGFLGGHISLSSRLVLLCSALATQFVLPGNRTCRFLGLALHIFHDALYSRFRTGVLVLTHFVLLFVFSPVCIPKDHPSKRPSRLTTQGLRMQQIWIRPAVGRVPS